MIYLWSAIGAIAGYNLIGFLSGNYAWGFKVIEGLLYDLVQLPIELACEAIGVLFDGLSDL